MLQKSIHTSSLALLVELHTVRSKLGALNPGASQCGVVNCGTVKDSHTAFRTKGELQLLHVETCLLAPRFI